jgi:hypothetical protein
MLSSKQELMLKKPSRKWTGFVTSPNWTKAHYLSCLIWISSSSNFPKDNCSTVEGLVKVSPGL